MSAVTPAKSQRSAQAFYKSFADVEGFECGLSAKQLRLQGQEPSHTIMNGYEWSGGAIMHAGSLYVPNDEASNKTFRNMYADALSIKRAMDEPAVLYISENRTLVFAMYFDLDIKIKFTADYVRFLYRIATSAPGLVFLTAHREMIDESLANDDPLPKVSLKYLYNKALFAMVITMQNELSTYYKNLPADSAPFHAFVTVSHGTKADEVVTAASEGQGDYVKVGSHVHFRHCHVNAQRARLIRMGVVHRMARDYGCPGVAAPATDEQRQAAVDHWSEVVDDGIYVSGGCRMICSYKAEKCFNKHTEPTRPGPPVRCQICKGCRKMHVDRYYDSLGVVLGGGQLSNDQFFMTNSNYKVNQCSIRLPDGTPMTDGFCAAGKPELTTGMSKESYSERFGAQALRKLEDKYGDLGADSVSYVAQVDAKSRDLCDSMGTRFVATRFEPILPSDPRFAKVCTLVEENCTFIHRGFQGVRVTHVKLQKGTSRVMTALYAYTASNLCQNRRISAVITEDNECELGEHNNRSDGTLFFKICKKEDGTAFMVQGCFSSSEEKSMRRSGRPCSRWYHASPPFCINDREAVQEMFLTPQERATRDFRSGLTQKLAADKPVKRPATETGLIGEIYSQVAAKKRTKTSSADRKKHYFM